MYLPFLNNPFVWEDRGYLINHPVSRDIRWLPKIFVPRLYRPANWEVWAQYRPLTGATFILDQQIWGDRAVPRRAVNLALHIAAGLAVWRLAGLFAPGAPAFWAALLYLLHPAHGEVIFWMNTRATVLAGALILWTIVLWLKGPPRTAWRLTPLYAIALLMKETALTLPLLLIAGDLALGNRIRDRWRAYVMLAVTGATYLIVRSHLLWMVPQPRLPAGLTAALEGLAAGAATLTEMLRLAIWPVGLSLWHPIPDHPVFASPLVLTGLLIASVWAGTILFAWRRWPAVGFGLAAAAVAHLPHANLVSIPQYPAMVTDRHLYMVLAGFAIAGAGILQWIQPKASAGTWRAVRAACLVLAVAFAIRTEARGMTWRDGGRIAGEFLAYHQESAMSQYMYASEFYATKRWREAAEAYRRAITIQPEFGSAWLNLATCERNLGHRWTERAALERAAALLPNDPRPRAALERLHRLPPEDPVRGH